MVNVMVIIRIIVLALASSIVPRTTNVTLTTIQYIYDHEAVTFFGPHRGPCSDPDATRDGTAQGAPGRWLAMSREASAPLSVKTPASVGLLLRSGCPVLHLRHRFNRQGGPCVLGTVAGQVAHGTNQHASRRVACRKSG